MSTSGLRFLSEMYPWLHMWCVHGSLLEALKNRQLKSMVRMKETTEKENATRTENVISKDGDFDLRIHHTASNEISTVGNNSNEESTREAENLKTQFQLHGIAEPEARNLALLFCSEEFGAKTIPMIGRLRQRDVDDAIDGVALSRFAASVLRGLWENCQSEMVFRV